MSWDFETDPAFQTELEWINAFIREEVEPLDHVRCARAQAKFAAALADLSSTH